MSSVVRHVKQGDADAARVIWDCYFPDLVRLAGQQLALERCGHADGEDVALSAMASFFRAAREGRFPELRDHDGLWRLLSTMTHRKVIDLVRNNRRRPVVGESAVVGAAYQGSHFDWLETDDPSPEIVAVLKDQWEHLLAVLPVKYRAVAMRKMECLTMAEIARECDLHISTVERHLRIIRLRWEQELAKDE